MKCMNPECESLDADEINISVNVSETTPRLAEIEYTGDTEYGDCSDLIGTTCSDCNEITYLPYWESIVLAFAGQASLVLPSTTD